MASGADETIHFCYSSSSRPEDDTMDDQDHHHNQPHPHNLSRLSTCYSNSTYGEDDEEEEDQNGIRTMLWRLSIESSFDGDADEEFSDEKDGHISEEGLFSDKEPAAACYSLPATPRRYPPAHQLIGIGVKEYASENEAREKVRRRRRRRNRRPEREAVDWDHEQGRGGTSKKDVAAALDDQEEELMMGMEMGGWNNYTNNSNSNFSFSGESEGGGGGGGGLMVITKPKGGSRSLCMDFEEVKACRDLGFELEHERMFEKWPSRLSLSASTLDTATTSSGGNSPIANWRISSPGDDPRDVKARLKVWAQAVALASTSRHGC